MDVYGLFTAMVFAGAASQWAFESEML